MPEDMQTPSGSSGGHAKWFLIIGAIVLLFFILRSRSSAASGGGIQSVGPDATQAQIDAQHTQAATSIAGAAAALLGMQDQTAAQLQLGMAQTNASTTIAGIQANVASQAIGEQSTLAQIQAAEAQALANIEGGFQTQQVNANAHAFEEAAKAGYNAQTTLGIGQDISGFLSSLANAGGGVAGLIGL